MTGAKIELYAQYELPYEGVRIERGMNGECQNEKAREYMMFGPQSKIPITITNREVAYPCLATYGNLPHSAYNTLYRVDQVPIYRHPICEEFFPGEPVVVDGLHFLDDHRFPGFARTCRRKERGCQ
jgi:hypothetical protein